jgi:hypothetical protein
MIRALLESNSSRIRAIRNELSKNISIFEGTLSHTKNHVKKNNPF